jgi:hypothetical protein
MDIFSRTKLFTGMIIHALDRHEISKKLWKFLVTEIVRGTWSFYLVLLFFWTLETKLRLQFGNLSDLTYFYVMYSE